MKILLTFRKIRQNRTSCKDLDCQALNFVIATKTFQTSSSGIFYSLFCGCYVVNGLNTQLNNREMQTTNIIDILAGTVIPTQTIFDGSKKTWQPKESANLLDR